MQLCDQSIAYLCNSAVLGAISPELIQAGRYIGRQPLIEPFDMRYLNPGTYDIHLGNELTVATSKTGRIDLRQPREYDGYTIDLSRGDYELLPGKKVKAASLERVRIPPNLQGRYSNKSSLARDWLIVEMAGIFDAGFGWAKGGGPGGVVVAELVNLSDDVWVLYPGMPIGQMDFTFLDGAAARPYGDPDLHSHYQFQDSATGNRFVDSVHSTPAVLDAPTREGG